MKLMDAHLHSEGLNNNSLQLMALSGIKAVINMVAIPEVVPGINKDFSPEAIFEYCDRVIDYRAWLTKQYFMFDTYVCVAISMAGVPRRYKEALDKLKTYIRERDQVVGIGEIGFEPDSPTCSNFKVQEELIVTQLEIAKQYGKHVCFHTPMNEKPKWFKLYLSMIKEAGLEPAKIIIDHADETIVKMVNESGCYAGITVQPRRKVGAIDAAKMINTGDRNKIFVNSDSSLKYESDTLAVPKTAFEMKKLGINESEIEKVLWENPRQAYGLL
jgi:predicted metal-dependent TIM-barrel fold hydrolase